MAQIYSDSDTLPPDFNDPDQQQQDLLTVTWNMSFNANLFRPSLPMTKHEPAIG